MAAATKGDSNTETHFNTNMIPLPTEDKLKELLSVAIEASKQAGNIIAENASGAAITERKANSRDLLTEIDPLCEKTIREVVLKAFPGHEFLGEEDVPPGKEASAAALEAKLAKCRDEDGEKGFLWIVDPIDGA